MTIVNCTASDNMVKKTEVKTFQASLATETLWKIVAGRNKVFKCVDVSFIISVKE